jgi:hypothetical protein
MMHGSTNIVLWCRNLSITVNPILEKIVLFYTNFTFSGICTYLHLTYSMEQTLSWEANRLAASQEIPRILLNPNVHYRIHKCSPPVPILTQLDPVHTPTLQFLRIHFNIILPSKSRSPRWSLSLRFLQQNHVYASRLPHTHYMPRTSHSSWFYHPKNIGW